MINIKKIKILQKILILLNIDIYIIYKILIKIVFMAKSSITNPHSNHLLNKIIIKIIKFIILLFILFIFKIQIIIKIYQLYHQIVFHKI